MAINEIFIKYYGPGGGTRHLHQYIHGGEIGSTDIEKYFLLLGIVPTLWNKFITANDNSREMAVAA